MLEPQETTPTFWLKFRAEAAKDILCALFAKGNDDTASTMVRDALYITDELIKQLRGDKK